MHVVSSWSGGKDSCLACYEAVSDGYKVFYLLNSVSKEYDRVSFHGVKSELISLQAQAIDVPIVQPRVTKDDYEQEFKKAILELKELGIRGAVFGDIELQEHRDWIERVCGELGVEPILPLWGRQPEQIFRDFIDAEFEAIVVSANADLLGKEWVGRRVDDKFVEDLRKVEDVDLCGEAGEYHTFVTDGPLFKRRIMIQKIDKVLKNGYWFLDILSHEIKGKHV